MHGMQPFELNIKKNIFRYVFPYIQKYLFTFGEENYMTGDRDAEALITFAKQNNISKRSNLRYEPW